MASRILTRKQEGTTFCGTKQKSTCIISRQESIIFITASAMVKNVGSDLIWPPTMKCIHAWHSCLKFLLLPSCTAPITAFSLLFLLMTGTIALYPSADVFFFCFSVHYFVVLNAWELSEGENEQMRITAPYAENVCASRRTVRRTQAHLHETEGI